MLQFPLLTCDFVLLPGVMRKTRGQSFFKPTVHIESCVSETIKSTYLSKLHGQIASKSPFFRMLTAEGGKMPRVRPNYAIIASMRDSHGHDS